MNWKKFLIPVIVIVVLVLPVVAGVFYTVHEGEQVVITEFGRPIGQPIVTAGLKVKTPFIQDVHRFEKRVLEWDGSPNQIPTKDKKFIWLDTTARWRTVHEGEQVVITEFGRPIGQPIVTAGLKVKTPFIQDVHRFEKRVLEWDGSPNQIPTKDKKFIWLDTTARWRIKDALKFYQALGTEEFAQSRLDDIIDSAARDLVTAQLLVEVVRDSNRILSLDLEELEDSEGQAGEALEEIQSGRKRITRMMLEKVQETVPQFGIELVDIQIKRINYVDEVRKKVFDRMVSERQRISEKYKSEGEGEAADIMGQKQKELERIQSEAYKEAEQLKGTADAQAIQIYAEAHGQDPEFFAFIQTLETYRQTANDRTKLILTTDSDLYRYLKSGEVLRR